MLIIPSKKVLQKGKNVNITNNNNNNNQRLKFILPVKKYQQSNSIITLVCILHRHFLTKKKTLPMSAIILFLWQKRTKENENLTNHFSFFFSSSVCQIDVVQNTHTPPHVTNRRYILS